MDCAIFAQAAERALRNEAPGTLSTGDISCRYRNKVRSAAVARNSHKGCIVVLI
jgi:hypothetical protein